ncbi:PAS domain-containing sensor histidine kinase [Clostridium rectalis]|uniref:PAS domain-containing sensor histidine kinase n=1 Tax=Clostridium rectalis TaxID=2040295 RepID=UPI000F62E8A9|nr:PAS domain-containing sensor histidine kinase [Clostridium rectalis]
MSKNQKKIILFLCLCTLFLGTYVFYNNFIYNGEIEKRCVLIIDSYHHNDISVLQEIQNIVNNNGIIIEKEYLDYKKSFSKKDIEKLLNYFTKKYKNKEIDMIISCNNCTSSFINEHHKKIFPNIPIAFYNNEYDYDKKQNNLNGDLQLYTNEKHINNMANLKSYTKFTIMDKDSIILTDNKMVLNNLLLNNYNSKGSVYQISREYLWISILISMCVLLGIIFILLNNIYKRKSIERVLKDSEKNLKNLIDAVPDLVCFKDGEGKYLMLNETNINILDLNDVDYKGKNDRELSKIVPRCKHIFERFIKSDELVWENKNIYRTEETIKDRNGNNKIFDVIKVPVYNLDGSRKGIGIIGRDITHQKINDELKVKAEKSEKLLEEVKENDKFKTEFFANVSHELRTPLNVMLSSIQLMKLYNDKGLIIDNGANLDMKIKILKQNCLRLLRLINNLIDITKIDSGFYKLYMENCNIVNVIEDITLSIAEFASSKEIELIFDTNVEEKIMCCDSEKIERIMLNLLSNAIKFTPRNGKICVALFDSGDEIKISIKDNGIGIPKNKQKFIFERFRQINSQSVRGCEGSGIGLSIVKALVDLHHGDISVDSEEGNGSEFIIKFPSYIDKNLEFKNNYLQDDNRNIIGLEFSDF